MSFTAAFYLDPIRDIYEVTPEGLGLKPLLMLRLGVYDLHLLSTPDQLPRR